MDSIRSWANEDLMALGNQGFAFALRILRNRDDAADAVQDALHQLIRKEASFDPNRGTIKALFLKIIRNRCIDMMRKARPTTGAETFNPVDTNVVHPAQQMQTGELVMSVQKALEQLPDEAREILLLRDFHSLSYLEIAQVLGIAQGTVMSRLHRARQRLREIVTIQQQAG